MLNLQVLYEEPIMQNHVHLKVNLFSLVLQKIKYIYTVFKINC